MHPRPSFSNSTQARRRAVLKPGELDPPIPLKRAGSTQVREHLACRCVFSVPSSVFDGHSTEGSTATCEPGEGEKALPFRSEEDRPFGSYPDHHDGWLFLFSRICSISVMRRSRSVWSSALIVAEMLSRLSLLADSNPRAAATDPLDPALQSWAIKFSRPTSGPQHHADAQLLPRRPLHERTDLRFGLTLWFRVRW